MSSSRRFVLMIFHSIFYGRNIVFVEETSGNTRRFLWRPCASSGIGTAEGLNRGNLPLLCIFVGGGWLLPVRWIGKIACCLCALIRQFGACVFHQKRFQTPFSPYCWNEVFILKQLHKYKLVKLRLCVVFVSTRGAKWHLKNLAMLATCYSSLLFFWQTLQKVVQTYEVLLFWSRMTICFLFWFVDQTRDWAIQLRFDIFVAVLLKFASAQVLTNLQQVLSWNDSYIRMHKCRLSLECCGCWYVLSYIDGSPLLSLTFRFRPFIFAVPGPQ